MANKPQTVSEMTPAQLRACITNGVFVALLGVGALWALITLSWLMLRM